MTFLKKTWFLPALILTGSGWVMLKFLFILTGPGLVMLKFWLIITGPGWVMLKIYSLILLLNVCSVKSR